MVFIMTRCNERDYVKSKKKSLLEIHQRAFAFHSAPSTAPQNSF
jgi:hypothetical protein